MKALWNNFRVWAQNEHALRILILVVIGLRAATLGVPALTDPSEARYATVAQHMVATGQWLIPEINRGGGWEPFWGKPPLHFWLTACSFRIFGFNEWAARFPSFLCSIAIGLLIINFAAVFYSRITAYLATLIAFSSFSFLVLAGASMTDMTLSCCTTGAMVGFALGVAAPTPRRGWAVAFFLFLALGMITKGPIALVFPGAAIFAWMILTKRIRLLVGLPWVLGTVLFIALAAPWFVLAEAASPGLNKYFFLNENILRFISRDYQDRYGSAHPIFRGAIWLFLLAGFFPWSFFVLSRARRFWSFLKGAFGGRVSSDRSQAVLYLFLWALVPMCFFTVARSVILTYVLPSIPPLALLTAVFILGLQDRQEPIEAERWRGGSFGAFAAAAAVAMLLLIVAASPFINRALSARSLVRLVSGHGATELFFLKKLPYSAEFYAEDWTAQEVSVGLIPDGQEGKFSCGHIAIPAKLAQQEMVKFPPVKSVAAVDGWQVLELESCGVFQ